jgi:ATP-binding cassette subfamily G (WHITE) protein 2 (PDR)
MDQRPPFSGPFETKAGANATIAPESRGLGPSDASVFAGSRPLNAYLDSDRPSIDLESDEFDPTQLFESLAGFRRCDPDRYPFKAFGVSFRNLGFHGYKTSTDYQYTFGNYPATLFSTILGSGKELVTVLNSFDGIVNPGEMLLVLERPGSGCSTLLKTIAGEMHNPHVGEKSEITYSGEYT